MNFYSEEIEKIYKKLSSSKDGLSEQQVIKNKEIYGTNILKERKKKSKLSRFIDQFKDMMIIILILVALITFIYAYFITKDYVDSIVIFVVVLINAIMGFVQQQKAEVTLESLKKYSKVNVKVKRDDKICMIDSEELVVGDLIFLEAGDKIPADSRIIDSTSLVVDESTLTGESVPVNKINDVIKNAKDISEKKNMLFSGCSITNGTVTAIVVAVGGYTELGNIATTLDTPYEVETPLQRKIKELSKKLTIIIFFIIIFMFIYGLINGYKVLEIIMLCVSLSVAAIPEGLPAVITICLSTGTAQLAKKNVVVRQMNAVETLGSTNVICSDKTGTITQNKMKIKETYIENEKMFNYISALCNEGIINGQDYIGDPTETSLYDYLIEKGLDPIEIRKKNKRLMENPFSSETKIMSTINEIDGKYYLLVKGSLENLIKKCNIKDYKELLDKEQTLSNKALRVIAFAYKEIKTLPKNIKNVEKDLNYVGMVGIIDPPRVGVKEAIKNCHNAGIRTIMITGDSLNTACAIAKDVGIIKSKKEGILGSELDNLSDEELLEVVNTHNVYARVCPEHKRRIVACLQKQNKVVGMTGDGVNDAPAIKDAHVGISMGITGTEVTKQVADIILLDDSFITIVNSIEEGRRIFSNIRNNIVYSLSSNFAEIFIVLIGMFTGCNILLPIQILFIDLVTDSIPSICLSFEKSEKNIMKQQPRSINKPMFTPFVNASIVSSAIIETIFVLITYFITLKMFDANIATTVSLLSLVMQEIIYSFSCRNLKDYTYKNGILSNKELNIGISILIVIEMIFFLTPVGTIISITDMGINLFILVVIFNLLSFIIYEVSKNIIVKYFKD